MKDFLKFINGDKYGFSFPTNREDMLSAKNEVERIRDKIKSEVNGQSDVENRVERRAKAVLRKNAEENGYTLEVDVPGYKGCELDVSFSKEQGFVVKGKNASRGEFSYVSGMGIFKKPLDIKTLSVNHEDGVVYLKYKYLEDTPLTDAIKFTL